MARQTAQANRLTQRETACFFFVDGQAHLAVGVKVGGGDKTTVVGLRLATVSGCSRSSEHFTLSSAIILFTVKCRP